MPDGTHFVRYGDDIAAIIWLGILKIIRTMSWLEDKGFRLPTKKTELIFLTRYTIRNQHYDMRYHSDDKQSNQLPRLDPRLTFWA